MSFRLGIIGGGASATLLLAHLLPRAPRSLEISWIERTGDFGLGLAYSTQEPAHQMNVPAENLSALASVSRDFIAWLDESKGGHMPEFQPRMVYGEYLKFVLARAEAAAPDLVKRVSLEARSVDRRAGGGYRVELSAGEPIDCDALVLAPGNPLPRSPEHFPQNLLKSSVYLANPWTREWLHEVSPDETVLCIGTGLTMVDVALSLLARERRAPIIAVSRHGLLPQPHHRLAARSEPAPASLSGTARSVLRVFREAARNGEDSRVTLDALKAASALQWRSLSLAEQRRFLRHLRAYWDSWRHRIPPESAARIAQARESGVLIARAGRLLQAWESPTHGAEVAFLPRRAGSRIDMLSVHRIINCTGADSRLQGDPLLRELLLRGLAKAHPNGLGAQLSEHGEFLGADGMAQPRLRAIGPLLRASFWEATAIPEIREQAERLADWVVGESTR